MASKGLLLGTVFNAPPIPVAIDFNGSDEHFLNDTAPNVGIANAWSIQINYEPAALTATMSPFNRRASNNRITFNVLGTLADDPLNIQLKDSSGTTFKSYRWTSIHTVDVKISIIATWDGSNLLLYINGTLTSPSTTPTDDAGTMADGGSDISIGSTEGEGVPDNLWDGKIHSASLWDTVLTQAQVTVLENSGTPYTFDNRVDSGAYNASANLVHYWLLGSDSDDIGKDYGTGTLIDLGQASENLTAADIVTY